MRPPLHFEKCILWEQSLQLLGQMREMRITRLVISFSAAISACGKGGQWARVLPLFDKMREEGITLDMISFSAAVSACEKGGQWARAERFHCWTTCAGGGRDAQ